MGHTVYLIEPGDWESATGECLPSGADGVQVVKLTPEVAAAPDLLEACKAAVRVKDLWMPPDNVQAEHFEECRTLVKLLEMFNAAITKATAQREGS